jgi:hypothetical protein
MGQMSELNGDDKVMQQMGEQKPKNSLEFINDHSLSN